MVACILKTEIVTNNKYLLTNMTVLNSLLNNCAYASIAEHQVFREMSIIFVSYMRNILLS